MRLVLLRAYPKPKKTPESLKALIVKLGGKINK